jgi:hypothetical protein
MRLYTHTDIEESRLEGWILLDSKESVSQPSYLKIPKIIVLSRFYPAASILLYILEIN